MVVAPEQHTTLEAFLALPEEEPALEFAQGIVTPKVAPKARHGAFQAHLAGRLDEACRRSGTACTFTEVRCTFAGASLVPDIAVYRRERVPIDIEGQLLDDLSTAPHIAIEIASPKESVTAIVRKCLWYVSDGVQVALLVDPSDYSIVAFRPNQPDEVWRGRDAIDVSGIVPEFRLTAQELFAVLHFS